VVAAVGGTYRWPVVEKGTGGFNAGSCSTSTWPPAQAGRHLPGAPVAGRVEFVINYAGPTRRLAELLPAIPDGGVRDGLRYNSTKKLLVTVPVPTFCTTTRTLYGTPLAGGPAGN